MKRLGHLFISGALFFSSVTALAEEAPQPSYKDSLESLEPISADSEQEKELWKGVNILWMKGLIAFHEAVFFLQPCKEDCSFLDDQIDRVKAAASALIRSTPALAIAGGGAYAWRALKVFKKAYNNKSLVIGAGGIALVTSAQVTDYIEELRGLSDDEKDELLAELREKLALLEESASPDAVAQAELAFPELAALSQQ